MLLAGSSPAVAASKLEGWEIDSQIAVALPGLRLPDRKQVPRFDHQLWSPKNYKQFILCPAVFPQDILPFTSSS